MSVPPRKYRILLLLAILPVGGCAWDLLPIAKPEVPPPPADSFVLKADGLVPQKPPEPGSAEADLAGARELFRKGEYAKAENLCHRLAENKKNPIPVCMEARYYEAESLRFQGCYPAAADTYVRVLKDFLVHGTPFREQACQHVFDIANYWLDDTRQEMRETREQREGTRLVVFPHFVSFEKSKPLVDREGRAIQLLENVATYSGLSNPLADKSRFLCGSVKFFNENYKDADYYFSMIYEHSPNSPLASQALELAIISKHLSTGGSDYDGRKVAEARKLVNQALRPNLPEKKKEFLRAQLDGITAQQADKDMKVAEFYRHTNHLGAAYFYYSLVTKRYAGTRFAQEAQQRMVELKEKVEKEEEKKAKEEASLPKSGKPGLFNVLSEQGALPPQGPPAPDVGTGGRSLQ